MTGVTPLWSISCPWALDGFSKIGEELLKTPNRTLMALDLSLPSVSNRVLHEFLFNATAATQTWCVLGRGHKLGARQIQLAFAGSLLWQPQAAPQF